MHIIQRVHQPCCRKIGKVLPECREIEPPEFRSVIERSRKIFKLVSREEAMVGLCAARRRAREYAWSVFISRLCLACTSYYQCIASSLQSAAPLSVFPTKCYSLPPGPLRRSTMFSCNNILPVIAINTYSTVVYHGWRGLYVAFLSILAYTWINMVGYTTGFFQEPATKTTSSVCSIVTITSNANNSTVRASTKNVVTNFNPLLGRHHHRTVIIVPSVSVFVFFVVVLPICRSKEKQSDRR